METKAGPTRAEHLSWCKKRALEYVRQGDINQAYSSMVSDLNKHDGTRGHVAIELGMGLLLAGHLNSPIEMQKFIEGFN